MVGLVQNSIIVGQGEYLPLIIDIDDEQGVLQGSNTVLFAMKDIDGNVKHTASKLVSELTEDNGVYTFTVELSSALTLSLDEGTYFFDVTLIDGDKKHPFNSPPNTLKVVKTIGASIVEDDNNGGE